MNLNNTSIWNDEQETFIPEIYLNGQSFLDRQRNNVEPQKQFQLRIEERFNSNSIQPSKPDYELTRYIA